MSVQGFAPQDFAVFAIDGLAPRMEALRERIQPKFRLLGDELRADLSALSGNEMHVHIAQHLRRTTNPPKDTWMAFASGKRGYKMLPHFQIGLFDDHLFLWFALIYELPEKAAIAGRLLRQVRKLKALVPDDYVISLDHTKKDHHRAGDWKERDWRAAMERLRDVRSAEFLVGRHLPPNDPLVADGSALAALARETFAVLMPFYTTAVAGK